MSSVEQMVATLGLEPHPEGGWFRRTWTAPQGIDTPGGRRATASGILFLLDEGMEARWHVVRSDELWLWHGPGSLDIHLGGSGPTPAADPRVVVLDSPSGPTAASDGANPVQVLIPAGTWQRAFARRAPVLATCVVSPEFTYDDWELAENA
ncbi:cupin domain-containing protein [Actinomyces sp. B33]|uniref:cupin domain-containing protein n=1 Tax=Actinomyces sp. B33 TaxID=2942131 RepID=UPI0023401F27|nr:cupin domain-containing protein [Actinomyces sp. B33]MDC4233956.1 cupin domain-containing protein [Actinomyces sp. B33]